MSELSIASAPVLKSVLVVDEDHNATNALEPVLRSEGYLVTIVHCGLCAGEWLADLKPDVITLDVAMPVLDATNALSTIRSIRELKSTKIIVVSGKPYTELEPLLEYGVNEIVEKPVQARVLVDRINHLIQEDLSTPYGKTSAEH